MFAIEFYNEGDLVDREYTCNEECANRFLLREQITDLTNPAFTEHDTGITTGIVYGVETDYDIYCPGCGVLLSIGLENHERAACKETLCTPVVINRITTDDEEFCEHGFYTKVAVT